MSWCEKTWYLSFCRKSVEKIKVSLTYDKNDVYFTRTPTMYIYDNISLNPSYYEKGFRKKVVENIETHILH
jgi:hypothetical protein